MLALICGTGALPQAVARAQATPPLVCVLEGFAPDGLEPDFGFRLEHLGSTLAELKRREVTRICLCGAITRPHIDPSQIDAETAPLVPRIGAAMAAGDDGALRVVIEIFEEAGFKICGASEIAQSILPEAGVLTKVDLPETIGTDVKAALTALAEMGARDLGQSCLVKDGQVIAMEDDAGTNALMTNYPTPGAILFKAPKPGQERRADLPTIGPDTARNAVVAGLSGIVIEADGVIVLDQPEVIRLLDEAEMFLWVREP